MPFKDKKTGEWIGTIRRKGLPRRVGRGFSKKKDAVEWERLELQRMLEPLTTDITFAEACSYYIDWCEKRQKFNTVRQKKFIIKSFILSTSFDPILPEVNSTIIEKYLDERFENKGGKAANRDLRELNSAFNWLIRKGYCDYNPCKEVSKYRTEQYIRYVPPPEDINAVLLQADDLAYDIIQCIYHTAARRIELQRAVWEDVNFTTGTWTLWTRKRQHGDLEKDELKMNAVLFQVLSDRFKKRNRQSPWIFCEPDGAAIRTKTLDMIMPDLCEAAGVKHFGFTAIRHHVASVLADSKKLSLIEIQKQLRHKRATTTDTYLKSLVLGENRAADILESSQKVLPMRNHQAASK